MGSKISGLRKNEDNNRKSRNFSVLGLECVIMYLDNRKRLELSLFYPRFRILEKKCPLKLDYLLISDRTIEIDETVFEFDSKHVCKFKAVNDPVLEGVHFGVLRFVQNLFVGRNRFRLGRFQLGIIIPFELSIDCDTVKIIFVYSQNVVNYSNVVRRVNRLFISCIGSPDGLNYPWVRNVNIVEMYSTEIDNFLPHLPDIPAKTIIVKFYSPKLYELIRVWCESRNGRVGSQLFIVIIIQKYEFNLNRLVEIGFIAEARQRWRLPMNNNSEAIFSIGDDYDSFREKYVVHSQDDGDYYCLEVVKSS